MDYRQPILKGGLLMSDLTQPDDAKLFPLSRVPDEVDKMHGVRPHRSAVYRWVKRGTSGVRLRVRSIGGKLHTSRPWLEAFFDATTAAKVPQSPTRKASKYQVSDRQAERFLINDGC